MLAKLSISALALLCWSGFVRADLPAGTKFIMSHFANVNGDNDERLYISISADGLNWTTLNNGQPVYQPANYRPFNDVVRDASIIYAHGCYWVAYTSGQYGYHASFGLVKSTDLLHWDYVGEISTAIPNMTAPVTWGPYFFEDGDGSIHVTVSISRTGGDGGGPFPDLLSYEMHALNDKMTQWSSPVLEVLPASITNELWLWKEGDLYHGIFVNFDNRASYYHMTAPTVTGPWKDLKLIGFNSYEGGYVMKLPEGGYRLYIERGGSVTSETYVAHDFDADFRYLRPQTVTSTVVMRNGKAIVVPTGRTYESWRAQFASPLAASLSDPAGDADGDGMSNLLEYATGTDPGIKDTVRFRSSGTPIAPWVTYRLTGGFSDLTVAVELSSDLQAWNAGSGVTHRLSATMMSDGTREIVEALPVPIAGVLQAARLSVTRTVVSPLPVAARNRGITTPVRARVRATPAPRRPVPPAIRPR